MAGLVGIGGVGVNDDRRLGVGRREDIRGADVGKFTSVNRGGKQRGGEEGNDFFHGGGIV